MEVAVPLVVGGLAGFSVATACGAEPRVPQVPPAELARQALETVAEKLPRELVENDLLKKIARSWASLAPAHRLGLVIEDASGRLAFLLLSSGVCCVLLTMVSLSPLGFALGLVAPIAVGAARDGFESRREQHDADIRWPRACALWALMRKNRCIPSFCGWRRRSIAASRRPMRSMTCSCASTPPVFHL